MVTRTFTLYGSSDPGTILEITIDNQTWTSIPSDGLLFKFDTDIRFHGASRVEVKSINGSVELQSCLATYPAKINRYSQKFYDRFFSKIYKGTTTIRQPIKVLFYRYQSGSISKSSTLHIANGDTVVYYHPMYNGPTEFLITCLNDIALYDGVDINFTKYDRFSCDANWGYDYMPFDLELLDARISEQIEFLLR